MSGRWTGLRVELLATRIPVSSHAAPAAIEDVDVGRLDGLAFAVLSADALLGQ
jgi:hypothetical protein